MTKVKTDPARVKADAMTALKQACINVASARTKVEMAERDRRDAIYAAWQAGNTQADIAQWTGFTQPKISRIVNGG